MISQQIFLDDDYDILEREQEMNNRKVNLDYNQSNNGTSNKILSLENALNMGVNDCEQSNEILNMKESVRMHSNDVTINSANISSLNYKKNKQEQNDEIDHAIYNKLQGQHSVPKTDRFTRLNEISINLEGADKRRQLLNRIDEDLENIRTKRQSILDTSNTQDEVKRHPIQYSVDSLFKKQNVESNNNINNNKNHHHNHPHRKTNENLATNISNINHQSLSQTISPSKLNNFHSDQFINKLKSRYTLNETLHQTGFQSAEVLKLTSKDVSIELKLGEIGKISQYIQQNAHAIAESNHSDRNHSSNLSQNEREGNTMLRPLTLIYMRRFVNQLKKSIYSSLYRNLKVNQVKLINDTSYFYEEGKFDGLVHHKKRYSQIKQKIKESFSGVGFIYDHYLKNIIISSQSNFYMLFQTCLLFSLFIQIYMVPLRICFNFDFYIDGPFYVITMITLPIFFIEILLNCITSYYQEGLEVRKQKKIIKKYIKNQFILDVITFCTLIVSLHSTQMWVSLVFLIRLKRIPKLINSIDDHFQLEHRFPSSFELLKLLLLIATIGHYCGCGFNYLGQYELRNNEYNWLQYKKIENSDWNIQYLNGLYFSFITMITVGYGDITPQTNKEIIYVLFMTLISCGTFGYSINTIGSIFREMQIRKSELKQDLNPILLLILAFFIISFIHFLNM